MPTESAIESLRPGSPLPEPALLEERALCEATRHRELSAVSRVLSATIAASGARFGVLLEKERTHARNLYGQRDDGSRIGRPDKLLRGDQIAEAFRTGEPSLRLERPPSGKWSLALPILTGRENRVLLFLGGTSAPGAAPPNAVPPNAGPLPHVGPRELARWTSCLSTAVFVDRLKTEVRHLRSSVARAHAPGGNTQPGNGLHLATLSSGVGPSRPPRAGPPGDQAALDVPGGARPHIPEIVGESVAVQKVLQLVSFVSRADLPVLIEGESGTGKELVARAIHRLSERRDSNFVCENCGAIPASLVEAELFGSVRGAFTGATESKPGIFEVAHRGTVFLDEIGEMDLEVQKKLLRVLQNHEIRPVGSSVSRRVDFRVISATNRILEEQVRQGRFREDLYFRLNVATIVLPPLRERADDIPLLVDHFNRESCERYDRQAMRFSSDALERLQCYPWPGNVRELQNEIRRLACTGRIRIHPAHLSDRILRESWPSPGQRLVKEEPHLGFTDIERELLGPVLTEAIRGASGNVAAAARRLKMSRASLYRRLKRYGVREYSQDGPVPARESPAC